MKGKNKMEKIKLSNGNILEITNNGVHSSDERLTVSIVAPDMDLVTMETLFTDRENVSRIELLSESDEVLRIYSGYVGLTNIEKRKNVVISVELIPEELDENGEVITEASENVVTSDVIVITLRKENESEARITSLEETVDLLIMSVLE